MRIEQYSSKRGRKEFEEARRKLESMQLGAVRKLLPDETIKAICEECAYYFVH